MTLENIWFFLVAVLLTVYVVLDGFDLGAGVLYPFISRTKKRRIVRASIGPVWDGNEVWLLTGAGRCSPPFPPCTPPPSAASTWPSCWCCSVSSCAPCPSSSVTVTTGGTASGTSASSPAASCRRCSSASRSATSSAASRSTRTATTPGPSSTFSTLLPAGRRHAAGAAAHARRVVARGQGRGSRVRARRQVAHAALPRLRRARRGHLGGHDQLGPSRLRQRARQPGRLALHRRARGALAYTFWQQRKEGADLRAFLGSAVIVMALAGIAASATTPTSSRPGAPPASTSLTVTNASSESLTLEVMLIIALIGVPIVLSTRPSCTAPSAAR